MPPYRASFNLNPLQRTYLETILSQRFSISDHLAQILQFWVGNTKCSICSNSASSVFDELYIECLKLAKVRQACFGRLDSKANTDPSECLRIERVLISNPLQWTYLETILSQSFSISDHLAQI